MKVLHAVQNYPPEFRGGVERVVESLAAEQRALGLDVSVVVGSERSVETATLEREVHAQVPVARLVRGFGLRDPIDPFRADLVPLFERVLEETRPDVLHVHHWFNLGGELVRRAARRGIPAVVTLHDAYSTCSLFFRLPDGATPCDLPEGTASCVPCIGGRYGADAAEVSFRVTMRHAGFAAELRAAAAVLAPSAAHASVLAKQLPRDILVTPLVPGSEPIEPVANTVRRGPLRVLHFGNLCRLKGAEVLAAAVRRADPDATRVRLVMAGETVEAGLELGGAQLVGPYDLAKLRELAADADLACFPSLARESYGLVVDEALRLGLPVLVSDRGALAERIGTRGRALPAGDEEAWAREIRRLADDPATLAELRAGKPGLLPTPADHARQLVAIYDKAQHHRLTMPDLETPLLARLAHHERRLGEILDYVAALGASKGPAPHER